VKLLRQFKAFLEDTVNLNQTRLTLLHERVTAITSYLEGDSVIGEIFKDVIPQGSMAHRTIIKPQAGREYDADILLELAHQKDWTPYDYIQATYEAFRRSGIYKSMVSRKSRCVRVSYAGDCHIDVVPCFEYEGSLYICNRSGEGSFERTNPVGYSQWLEEHDGTAAGNLIRSIRMMKWLRDYKTTFTCRSIILNVLLSETVTEHRLISDPQYYKDVPTSFVHILEDLATYLQPYSAVVPTIADPSCPEVTFNHRWSDDAQFFNLRECIMTYAAWAREAYDAPTKKASLAGWQKLFGEQFDDAQSAAKAVLATDESALEVAKSTRAPAEQFIDDLFPRADTSYRVRIAGRTRLKAGFRSYDLHSHGNRIERSREIDFRIVECNVPEPFDVLWKIRNRGDDAINANALRGEIRRGSRDNGRGHHEQTQYRGEHYVECYIIKDGKCVASHRQPVIIA